MNLNLIIPWPPSLNAYKRLGRIVKTKTGKTYQQRVNSDETRTFYFQVYQIAKKYKLNTQHPYFLNSEVKLAVSIVFHPPHRNRKWDLDNRLKVFCDSLIYAHIIIDDSQIHRLVVEKGDYYEGGKTEFTIEPLTVENK